MAAHREAERFDFDEERHTGVYVCARVAQGSPILYVSHDADGDWQFLCGGTHEDGASAIRGAAPTAWRTRSRRSSTGTACSS